MATSTLLSLRNHVLRILKRDPGITVTEIDAEINRGIQEIAAGVRMPDGDYISPALPDLLETTDVKIVESTPYLTLPSTYNRDLYFCLDENDTRIEIYDSFPHFLSVFTGLDRAGKITGVCTQGDKLYYQGRPSTTDVDGVCESQTITSGVAMTINGDLASDGAVSLSKAKYVSVTSLLDLSGDTFTVVGTDDDGAAQTETFLGPNATITYSVNKFKTITSVTLNNGATLTTVGIADYLKVYYYRSPVDMSATTDNPDGIPEHLQVSLLVNFAVKELAPEVNSRFAKGSQIDINFYEAKFAKALTDLHLFVPYNGESLYLLEEV